MITRTDIVEEALKYLGNKSIRYVDFGKGKSPGEGFDCSGFVRFVLGRFRMYIPRHCNEMIDTAGIFVHPEHRSRGDLIFLSRDGLRPTHVGILISRDEYIHAPGVTDSVVCITSVHWSDILCSEPQEQIYSRNPIAIKRLGIRDGRWFKALPE